MKHKLGDCVIYWSKSDDLWVSHCLRTDQIGLGPGPVYALADMMKAVKQVMAVAVEDKTVQPWREAPERVQAMFAKGEKLPKEMVEVAYKMVHGDWPAYLKVECEPKPRKRFAVDQIAMKRLEPTTA